MNEVTTRMAMDNIKTNRTVNDTRTRGRTNRSNTFRSIMIVSFIVAPTDLDLLQLTMNRMQKAESEARYLTSELKDKVKEKSNLLFT